MPTNDVARFSRMITNLYTAVFERGAATQQNRPIRLIANVQDTVNVDDDNGISFNTNIPRARYYADLSVVGSFSGTFGSFVANNYLLAPLPLLDVAKTKGCIIIRFRPQFAHGASVNSDPCLLGIEGDGSHWIYLFYHRTDNTWHMGRASASGGGTQEVSIAAGNFASNSSVHLTAFWSATQIGIALGAGALQTVSNSKDIGTVTTIAIGGGVTGADGGECIVDWMLLGNGTVDNTIVADYAALTSTDKGWIDLPTDDSFYDPDWCLLWNGNDVSNIPTALYGENIYAS